MSPHQSGPYESHILRFVTRQTRQLIDKATIAVRRIKLAATWGAQIVLYPAYVLFQATRVLGAQVKQAVALELPKFRQKATPPEAAPPEPRLITSETPIQQVFKTIESFTLPATIAPPLPASSEASLSSLIPASGGTLTVQGTNPLVQVRSAVHSLIHRVSHAIVPQEKSAPLQASTSAVTTPVPKTSALIRGIASLLETRSLVLVTIENQVLDILTVQQQETLRHRIIWEVAHYGRYLKLRATTRQAFARLSSAPQNSHVLPPVRWFWQAMAWAQKSPLAIAANLFQEAKLVPPLEVNSLPPVVTASTTPAPELKAAAPGLLPAGIRLQLPVRFPVPLHDLPIITPVTSAVQSSRKSVSMAVRQIPQVISRLLPPIADPRLLAPAVSSALALAEPAALSPLSQETSLAAEPLAFSSLAVSPGSVLESFNSISISTGEEMALSAAIFPASFGIAATTEPCIETEATLLGYDQSPVERVLRWLDRALLWLEDFLFILWKQLRQFLGI